MSEDQDKTIEKAPEESEKPKTEARPQRDSGERSERPRYNRERSGGYRGGERSGDKDDSYKGFRRGGQGKKFPRRKVCVFCAEKGNYIDYKDMKKLKRYVTERGKILPRRISGNCAYHQRKLTIAVKRARNAALLPFKAE